MTRGRHLLIFKVRGQRSRSHATHWVTGQGHKLHIVVKPCKHDTDWTISAMTIKFGTHTSYDKRTTLINFQGQGSKVEVTRYTLLLNLVNMIQTEPFQLWPSNLVRTLLMTRRWHLYIFKVMGQRSKINPFYIANYKVIFLFKSPVGRILQRWRCFGIFKIQKYLFIQKFKIEISLNISILYIEISNIWNWQ